MSYFRIPINKSLSSSACYVMHEIVSSSGGGGGGGWQLELLGYSISHCDRVNLELFNRLAVKLKWTADVSLNYYSIIPSFYSDFMFNQRQKKRAVDACLCQ